MSQTTLTLEPLVITLSPAVHSVTVGHKASFDYTGPADLAAVMYDDQGNMTADLDVAKRTVEAVREVCPGITQLSTGGLAFTYEQRMALVEAKPAMATLNSAGKSQESSRAAPRSV